MSRIKGRLMSSSGSVESFQNHVSSEEFPHKSLNKYQPFDKLQSEHLLTKLG